MNDRSANAFFLSGALHALGAGLLVLMTYSFRSEPDPPINIFELVAGEGDNYMATAAPALGSSGGIQFPKTELPAPKAAPLPEPKVEEAPAPSPMPVSPKAQPQPEPVQEKAPSPMPTTAKAKEKAPAPQAVPKVPAITPVKQLKQKVATAEANARLKVKRDNEAAAKAAKLAADNAARAKANAAKLANFERIDSKGIAKGVLGGSTANTTGGAGGKALTASERNEVEGYTSLLVSSLQDYLNKIPGLDDGLRAEVEVRVLSDGRLAVSTLVTSPRNQAFEDAIRQAIRSLNMPPRPKGLPDVLTIPFSTRARS